jgi:hypothetical protein
MTVPPESAFVDVQVESTSGAGPEPPPLPAPLPSPLPSANGPVIAAIGPPKNIAAPTPGVMVQDRPKVIRTGRKEIAVRRLTADEKSERRFWKNVILWVVCVLLLLALCYFLAHRQ